MPTYLYKCIVHGEFEVIHSMNDLIKVCPQCGSDVKRLINTCFTHIEVTDMSKASILTNSKSLVKFVGEENYETHVKRREKLRQDL